MEIGKRMQFVPKEEEKGITGGGLLWEVWNGQRAL